MKFSDKKLALIQQELKKKNVITNCTRCNNSRATISNSETQLLSFEREKIEIDLSIFQFRPVVSIICANCGAIQLFDLETLIGKDNTILEK